jgi:hypothetical protein
LLKRQRKQLLKRQRKRQLSNSLLSTTKAAQWAAFLC